MPKTSTQIKRDIAAALGGGEPKPRKRKAGGSPPTKIEQLTEDVEQGKAAVRSMFRHGTPAAQTEASSALVRKKRELAVALASDLLHSPSAQGGSLECFRCGASGYFGDGAGGTIFREACPLPMFKKEPTTAGHKAALSALGG